MPLPAGNPNITLHFYGLEVLCFNPHKGYCQIAFHNTAPDHNLKVYITTKYDGETISTVPLVFGQDQFKHVRELWLDVEDPDVPENSGRPYMGTDPFDRKNGKGDPNDIRWLIDLESDVYKQPLQFYGNVLRPSLFVRNALFYTERRTDDNYTLYPRNSTAPPIPLGKIAQWVGANMYLDVDSSVKLTAGYGGPELVRFNYGVIGGPSPDQNGLFTYDVTFDNSESAPYRDGILKEAKVAAVAGDPCANASEHFENYYLAFKIPDCAPRYCLVDITPPAGLGTPPCNPGGALMSDHLPLGDA